MGKSRSLIRELEINRWEKVQSSKRGENVVDSFDFAQDLRFARSLGGSFWTDANWKNR